MRTAKRIPNFGQSRCDECFVPFQLHRAAQRFCSIPCRNAWWNRHAARGKQLVPIMARWLSEREGGWLTDSTRLLRKWRDEDQRRREDCLEGLDGEPQPAPDRDGRPQDGTARG